MKKLIVIIVLFISCTQLSAQFPSSSKVYFYKPSYSIVDGVKEGPWWKNTYLVIMFYDSGLVFLQEKESTIITKLELDPSYFYDKLIKLKERQQSNKEKGDNPSAYSISSDDFIWDYYKHWRYDSGRSSSSQVTYSLIQMAWQPPFNGTSCFKGWTSKGEVIVFNRDCSEMAHFNPNSTYDGKHVKQFFMLIDSDDLKSDKSAYDVF